MLFLLALLQLQGEIKAGGELTPRQVIRGVIEATDSTIRTQILDSRRGTLDVRAKRFNVIPKESGPHHIVLASHSFDAYLVLKNSKGDTLAEDDDGWIQSQSLVAADLTAGENYYVYVCAVNGGIGSFELSFLEGKPESLTLEDMNEWYLDSRGISATLRIRADKALDRGEIEEAQAILEHALDLSRTNLGDRNQETAACLQELGRLLLIKYDLKHARSLIEQAIDIQIDLLGPQDPQTCRSFVLLGQTLSRQGDFENAKNLYLRALDGIRGHVTSDETRVNFARLLECAEISCMLGEWADGKCFIQICLPLADRLYGSEHHLVAFCVAMLGNCYLFEGDPAQAKVCYERALAVIEKEKVVPDILTSTIPVRARLANLVMDEGNLEYAQRLLESTISTSSKVFGRETVTVALSMSLLGYLEQQEGNLDKARDLFQGSISILRQALGESDHHYLVIAYRRLADLEMEVLDLPHAHQLLELAQQKNSRDLGPFRISDQVEIQAAFGKLYFLEGNFEKAKESYRACVQEFEQRSDGNRQLEVHILHDMSSAFLEQGDLEGAWRFARLAMIAASRSLTKSLWSLSEFERYRFLETQRIALDSILSLAEILRTKEAREFSFEAVSRWKAQVFKGMRATKGRVFQNTNEEMAGLLAQLRTVQSQLSALFGIQEPSDLGLYAEMLGELRRRRSELEKKLERSVASRNEPGTMEWKSIRNSLPPGAACINFFEHRDYVPSTRENGRVVSKAHWSKPILSAWVLGGADEEPKFIRLGSSSEIEEIVREFLSELVTYRPQLGGASNSRFPKINSAVLEKLWTPLVSSLKGDFLFISSDANIGNLPFGVLRQKNGRYLIEDYRIVYLQDLSDLQEVSLQPTSHLDGFLTVGGVNYQQIREGADANARIWGANSQSSWMPLPSTLEEVESVARLHEELFPSQPRRILVGDEASEETLKRELPRYQLVHIASHGYFAPKVSPNFSSDWGSPNSSRFGILEEYPVSVESMLPALLSGIVCAGANSPVQSGRENGLLTAEEVGWLDLSNVDLVVLSACQTGLGTMMGGEGIIGLRSALRQAGAKTVISSLWSVGDRTTKDLMQYFYAGLWAEKKGRIAALRDAQMKILAAQRSANNGDSFPYAWGAFVLDGNWR